MCTKCTQIAGLHKGQNISHRITGLLHIPEKNAQSSLQFKESIHLPFVFRPKLGRNFQAERITKLVRCTVYLTFQWKPRDLKYLLLPSQQTPHKVYQAKKTTLFDMWNWCYTRWFMWNVFFDRGLRFWLLHGYISLIGLPSWQLQPHAH